MSRILRMNPRRMAELAACKPPPSYLLQVLLVAGFSAEMNLLNIAEALGQKTRKVFITASERNAKMERLRKEIEEQAAAAVSKQPTDEHDSQKILVVVKLAVLFEKMGTRTVDLAALCEQVVGQPQPSRTADIKKLLEHAAYMADSTAAALVYDEKIWAKGALEQGRAAISLQERISHEIASCNRADETAAVRMNLLASIVSNAHDLIEEIVEMTNHVIKFLDQADERG